MTNIYVPVDSKECDRRPRHWDLTSDDSSTGLFLAEIKKIQEKNNIFSYMKMFPFEILSSNYHFVTHFT